MRVLWERLFWRRRFGGHRIDALLEALGKGERGKEVPWLDKERGEAVVTLTSFPARLGALHYTIYSILNQNLRPKRVILWLAEEEFPAREESFTTPLRLLMERGLEVRWCENWRSYKKIIPALKELPDEVLVTCDDDLYYPTDWLERLWRTYEENPSGIKAHRAHRVRLDERGALAPYHEWEWTIHREAYPNPSFLNFATGVGGVLYPPHSLMEEVVDSQKFLELAPMADDVWLWAMEVLAGSQIEIARDQMRQRLPAFRTKNNSNLCDYNVHQRGNDVQLARILEAYPRLLARLQEEA